MCAGDQTLFLPERRGLAPRLITAKEELEDKMKSTKTNEPNIEENLQETEDEPKSKRSKLDALLGIEETGGTPAETNELEEYLAERNQPGCTDPLSWGENAEKKFPGLSCIAKRHLGIPSTYLLLQKDVFKGRSNSNKAKKLPSPI